MTIMTGIRAAAIAVNLGSWRGQSPSARDCKVGGIWRGDICDGKGRVIVCFLISVLCANFAAAFSYPSFGVARWTAYMMGVDTEETLSSVKGAVAGKGVTVAIANSETSTQPGQNVHDDYMESEMSQIATYLGLSMTIVRIPPQDLKTAFEAAVAVGDIVVDYHSYWDESTVAKATSVIAANPDKLFILPYGEIASCPPTSTSLQGQALRADGAGFANLVNTIPLAYGFGGKLFHPLRRTASDTSAVSFVVPTAWANDIGETCPSAAALSAVAACLFAAHGGRPTASELIRLLTAGAGYPRVLAETEFDAASLAQVKADISEMTAVDALGRKMLLYDKVVSLKGSMDVLMSERAGVYADDSFEGYAVNTEATLIDGWHGDGIVVEDSYSPPKPPGFPMPKILHTKILDTEGDAARVIPKGVENDVKMDVMVCACRASSDLESLDEDIQVQVASDLQGRLCLWHLYEENGSWKKGWIPLSETMHADREWVRLGIELDYTSNSLGDAFVKVTVNGSCQPTAHGVRSPTDTRSYGPWHYLAKNRLMGGVSAPSEISFSGTKVDDLMLAKKTVVPEHEGPTSVDGIEFSWFDNAGLPRDPSAAAPFVPGYTLRDVYTAGIDPYSDRPFEVTGFELGADGRPHVEFNGFKGENPVGYHVLYSTTPDFKDATTLGASDGAFDGDASTWSTTWDGRVAVPSTAGFYKVEAVK